jgi:hypothetical protein
MGIVRSKIKSGWVTPVAGAPAIDKDRPLP